MRYLFSMLVLSLLFISCGGDTAQNKLDLMKYGMPITIAAPEGSEIVSEDLGFMKDITVKSGDNYFIQILAGAAIKLDPVKIKEEKLAEVKNGPFFSKIIKEDDHGFVFEKKIDEQNINYDFRHIRIQGDKEYVFQTGLIGRFTQADVEKMYESVK